MRRWKYIALFLCLCAASASKAQTVYFKEIRERSAKINKLSPEDFKLGKELMTEIRKLAATRKPALKEPLLLMESVSFAGRLYFTAHLYTDRRLFAGRDVWEPGPSRFKTVSHHLNFRLMEAAGFDANNCFLYGEEGKRHIEDHNTLTGTDFKFVPTITPAGYNGKLEPELFKMASESPKLLKVNGKMLVVCWTFLDIPKTKNFVASLEKAAGMPIAYIHSCGTVPGMEDPFVPYINGEGVPASILLYWFDHLSEILKTADGIEVQNYYIEPDTSSCSRYYREVILPLFAAICAQKQYNGKKILGLQIMTGYNNYRGRQRLSNNGTKTLRSYMELCREFKIDLMKAFEWDQYNEDSHFQPTVSKPMSFMRITRYYSALLKGRKITPFPGDDLSIPNLIISHRKQQVAGNDYELEILNLPDTDKDGENFSAEVKVVNENGKLLAQSGKLHFNTAEIKDHTLKIPVKDYLGSRALMTEIKYTYKGKSVTFPGGLPFTVVRKTAANDAVWFSTPLRNVLIAEKALVNFGKGKTPAGALPEIVNLPLSAALSFPDKITTAEVLQDNRDTRFTFDPENEFRQNDPDRKNLILSVYYCNPEYIAIDGRLTFENVPSAIWFEEGKDPKAPGMYNPSVKAIEKIASRFPDFRFTGVSSWRNARIYSVKEAELENGKMVISGRRFRGPNTGKTFKWEVPLAKLKKSGIQSVVFEDGLQLAIEIPQRLDDIPLPLDSKNAEFSTVINTAYPDGVFGVRAVSRSGKVWWSKPHILSAPASGKKSVISVCRDKDLKVEKFTLDSAAVPHIAYRFDPEIAGNILTTPAGREFYGNAGGYDTVPTGFEGYHCSVYAIPYSFRKFRKNNGVNPAVPRYEKLADGSWCLNFSGKGEFIGFPPSLFPQRTGFTVKMELMPLETDREQVYFVHAEHEISGFRLRTEDYRLVVDFYRRQYPGKGREDREIFKTSLDPVEGKWNKIEFKYDLERIYVTLNGKTESFPCRGLARHTAVGGFGGDGTTSLNGDIQYFKGKLKSFEVIHSVKEK
ncbi:MAG: hypothetical protein IJW33_05160 [Lentisphaeria bacterium]|nr:hypothetical protein [Lentisphaeria bacterium]